MTLFPFVIRNFSLEIKASKRKNRSPPIIISFKSFTVSLNVKKLFYPILDLLEVLPDEYYYGDVAGYGSNSNLFDVQIKFKCLNRHWEGRSTKEKAMAAPNRIADSCRQQPKHRLRFLHRSWITQSHRFFYKRLSGQRATIWYLVRPPYEAVVAAAASLHRGAVST